MYVIESAPKRLPCYTSDKYKLGILKTVKLVLANYTYLDSSIDRVCGNIFKRANNQRTRSLSNRKLHLKTDSFTLSHNRYRVDIVTSFGVFMFIKGLLRQPYCLWVRSVVVLGIGRVHRRGRRRKRRCEVEDVSLGQWQGLVPRCQGSCLPRRPHPLRCHYAASRYVVAHSAHFGSTRLAVVSDGSCPVQVVSAAIYVLRTYIYLYSCTYTKVAMGRICSE